MLTFGLRIGDGRRNARATARAFLDKYEERLDDLEDAFRRSAFAADNSEFLEVQLLEPRLDTAIRRDFGSECAKVTLAYRAYRHFIMSDDTAAIGNDAYNALNYPKKLADRRTELTTALSIEFNRSVNRSRIERGHPAANGWRWG